MKPTVMRSLGGVALVASRIELGASIGAARPVAAAAPARLRKVRRVMSWFVFISVFIVEIHLKNNGRSITRYLLSRRLTWRGQAATKTARGPSCQTFLSPATHERT